MPILQVCCAIPSEQNSGTHNHESGGTSAEPGKPFEEGIIASALSFLCCAFGALEQYYEVPENRRIALYQTNGDE